MSNIPLLDVPLAIIEKYQGDKNAAKKGVLLPIPCNQVMNRYLKEIATICRINKHLTMHTARHYRLSSNLKMNSLRRSVF